MADDELVNITSNDKDLLDENIVKRGEVWVAELGKGSGSIQYGRRPVLIMQNDVGNRYSDVVTVIPLTSKDKRQDLPVHVFISEPFLLKDSEALVEQIRAINKSQLVAKVGRISQENQTLVDDAFLIQHGFKRKFGNSIDNQYETC